MFSSRWLLLVVAVLAVARQVLAQEDEESFIPCPPAQCDLPGPAVLRKLAVERQNSAANELDTRYKEYRDGRGTDIFLIDAARLYREATCDASTSPEVHLQAWEAYLKQMLECEDITQARIKAENAATSPFRSAVAEAKLGLGTEIFAQPQPAGGLPCKELERLWQDLGSPDVAHACRARWTLQAAGPAAADFLRSRIEESAMPTGKARDLIAYSDHLGEVKRSSAQDAAAKLDKEKASRQRRLLRALDLLKEMDKGGGRSDLVAHSVEQPGTGDETLAGQLVEPDARGPDPRPFRISLELKHPIDLPGSPALRELVRQKYEAEAAELGDRWEDFLAGRGTYEFLVRSSFRLMEAQDATSRNPEVQLDALEGHLQRMLLAMQYRRMLWDAGRIIGDSPLACFPWAVADTEIRLATAIFEQRAKAPPGPEELEHLWIEVGCRDTAHACRVRWEIQSAGAAAEEFLWLHLAGLPPEGVSPDRIIERDDLGEVFVERNPRYIATSATPEQEEEDAARHRRRHRAFDLLREMGAETNSALLRKTWYEEVSPEDAPIAVRVSEGADREKDEDDYNEFLPWWGCSDLPGPAVLRTLAQCRKNAAACKLDERYKEFLAGRGTDQFVLLSARRWREAYYGLSLRTEVHILAWQWYLRQMLECEHRTRYRIEQGRALYNPFRAAVAEAKVNLAAEIFAQPQPAEGLPREELERLWTALGSRDVALACRAHWTLQAAGPAAADFLRRCVRYVPVPTGKARDLVAYSDDLGEVIGPSGAWAGLNREEACQCRSVLRALDLLAEIDEEGVR